MCKLDVFFVERHLDNSVGYEAIQPMELAVFVGGLSDEFIMLEGPNDAVLLA